MCTIMKEEKMKTRSKVIKAYIQNLFNEHDNLQR